MIPSFSTPTSGPMERQRNQAEHRVDEMANVARERHKIVLPGVLTPFFHEVPDATENTNRPVPGRGFRRRLVGLRCQPRVVGVHRAGVVIDVIPYDVAQNLGFPDLRRTCDDRLVATRVIQGIHDGALIRRPQPMLRTRAVTRLPVAGHLFSLADFVRGHALSHVVSSIDCVLVIAIDC